MVSMVDRVDGCFILYKHVVLTFPGAMTEVLMCHFNLHAAVLGNLASCYVLAFVLVQCYAGS